LIHEEGTVFMEKVPKIFNGFYGGQWGWLEEELPCFLLRTLYNRLRFPERNKRNSRATQQEKLWPDALIRVLRASSKMLSRPQIPFHFRKSSDLSQEISKLNRKSKDISKYEWFFRNIIYIYVWNKISYLA
jgi:hypothetical protein